ncbi:MAG: snoRNA-binding protein [Vezdaea acicularis]|nr:MAG: snoRNA-binding protein [Vezdaea acicularis]
MGKEKVDKKEKKEKKEKRSEKDGVHKREKKEKREKKLNGHATEEVMTVLGAGESEIIVLKSNGESNIKSERILGALVPFANPLADDKVGKKVLKAVKKAAKNKCLKRGVKEVVKALRKSPVTLPSSGVAPGVIILAADISPMDVISHIPVLCEDHHIPYLYVPSRAELGAAGNTKRPTSVVMISAERGGKRKEGEKVEEGEEEFKSIYKDLVKIVEKEGRSVKI